MSSLYWLTTVTEREKLSDLLPLLKRNRVAVTNVALGYGTATNETLGALGLNDSERAVTFSVATGTVSRNVKKALREEMHLDRSGNGIMFIIKLSSVGGPATLQYLTFEQGYEKEEESVMKNTDFSLLIAVSNQGYAEVVMDAAKKAGASGGTIIHAQGTGKKDAEKFLGISLASEKDMLFIVTPTTRKNAIMEAIMKGAGLETPAKAIVFSLPVTTVAGIRMPEDETEDAQLT